MQGKAKRIIAALVGVAMVTAPVSAWAGEYCSTYHQVASHNTGGDWVGGILAYESWASVTRSDVSTTNTVTTTIGLAGGLGSTTVTSTTTQSGNSTTTQEPIGIYNMNDGTVWEVNCLTGASRQIG
jgi:hypothetical protein